MLAVVNQPHIEIRAEQIPAVLMRFLRDTFGSVRTKKEAEKDDCEELVDVFETEWYKEISAKMTPGGNLKLLRQNRNLTPKKLSAESGVMEIEIKALESGKLAMQKPQAAALANALGTTLSNLYW